MADVLPDSFLGLDAAEADYANARFAVLPIPYDATTSYGVGARAGPRAIITASQQVELYDPELRRSAPRGGVATLSPLEPDARGPQFMHERIRRTATRAVRDGKFLIGLGGEHGITSALVRAVRTKHRKLSVLQIDAHADLRNEYQNSPYSHACVMRRIHEHGDTGRRRRGSATSPPRKPGSFAGLRKVPLFSARDLPRSRPTWIDEAVVSRSQQTGIRHARHRRL